ncbi:hypothetical protein [Phenylobacterium sp.]|uniref:hypothetical protein n=1 Tax=Phenylobacterium sp. TaxID=1871053 RepID=UPI001217B91A|nr:hypothetical protein [Phenylobacterium sp.]THD58625.1 MAG: hypothetical protein E8A49_19085 [Phenylobacterium sp.]
MKSIVTAVVPFLCLTLVGASAFAQEAIRTGDGGAPPHVDAPVDGAVATENDPEALDAWAQRTLKAATDKALAKPAAPSAQCAAIKADGKPHGEVWAGAGTQGYREVGGVVTQPVGDCSSVTLMVDHTQGGYGYSGTRAR